jgi:hypothetical protein
VKLHEELLEVDLKEGVRKEFEDLAEAKPILRETLGMLYQFAGPLDVELKDIDKVLIEKDGRVKVVIPNRRDLHIPLTPQEAQTLMGKLDELIPLARKKAVELEKLAAATRAQYEAEANRYRDQARRPM